MAELGGQGNLHVHDGTAVAGPLQSVVVDLTPYAFPASSHTGLPRRFWLAVILINSVRRRSPSLRFGHESMQMVFIFASSAY